MTKNRAPLRSLVRGGGISYGIVQPGEHDPDGVPVVRVGDLAGGKLDGVAPVLRVTRSIEERFAKTRLTGGEVLVSVVGSVGTCALVPPSHAGWNVARAIAVLRPDVVEARWLLYALRSPEVQGAISERLNTTVQPTLNLGDLGGIELPVPPRDVRDSIADVLGALDDKIAANKRANMSASALSRSLLVRASASIPLVPLGQLVDVPRKTVAPAPGGVWHFSLPAFDDGEVPKLDDGAEIKSAKQRLDRPAVLLSKLNPRIPRVWDVATIPKVQPALASTEFIVLEPRSASTAELAEALRLPTSLDGLRSLARGTSGSHQRVSPTDAMALEIPDVTQLPDAIRESMRALAAATASRRRESVRLAATRDTLLPELMSGRLTVNGITQGASG